MSERASNGVGEGWKSSKIEATAAAAGPTTQRQCSMPLAGVWQLITTVRMHVALSTSDATMFFFRISSSAPAQWCCPEHGVCCVSVHSATDLSDLTDQPSRKPCLRS